jgi:hypothetical protein
MEHQKRKIPYLLLIILAIIVATLHAVGLRFSLYWQLPWYDRIVHPLGGFLVALAVVSVMASQISTTKRSSVFVVCILAAFIIGFGWEVYEVQSGVTVLSDKGYWFDTIGDMVSDLVGGFICYWYITKDNRYFTIQA